LREIARPGGGHFLLDGNNGEQKYSRPMMNAAEN
jgi:hypothetical protein